VKVWPVTPGLDQSGLMLAVPSPPIGVRVAVALGDGVGEAVRVGDAVAVSVMVGEAVELGVGTATSTDGWAGMGKGSKPKGSLKILNW
jgi:hypothetical protein